MNEKPPNQKDRLTANGAPDLFEPSLQDDSLRQHYPDPPWRLDSQFYVAFFGGVLAEAVIAYLNGKRLLLDASQQRKIVYISALAMAATLASAALLNILDVPDDLKPGEIGFRLVNRGIAVIAFLFLRKIQNSAFRVYVTHGDQEFASLWIPGLLAVFGVGLIQGLLVSAVVLLTS
jgi:hypothetical protein